MRGALIAIVGACVLLVGCRKEQPQQPVTLTVLCGTSFRPPMEALEKAFEEQSDTEVQLSLGQSEELLPQVKIGKQGDVFVSHDPYMDYTKDAGALLEAVQVGYVAPVIVVRKGSSARVKSIGDLAKPGVRLALPDPEFSTCGQMLFKLLEKKGIKDAVLKNADGALFRSHSETANTIKVRELDAGVMWNGTAHTFKETLEIVPTPYEYDETTTVYLMGLSYSKHQDAVKEFLEFVKSAGPPIFAEHGYVK